MTNCRTVSPPQSWACRILPKTRSLLRNTNRSYGNLPPATPPSSPLPPKRDICKSHFCGSPSKVLTTGEVSHPDTQEKNGPLTERVHSSCVMRWGDQWFSHLEATFCDWESKDSKVRLGWEYWLLHLLAQPPWKGQLPSSNSNFLLHKGAIIPTPESEGDYKITGRSLLHCCAQNSIKKLRWWSRFLRLF